MLWKVIAGSRAYGLHTKTSDTDIRGIYAQPNERILGLGYKEQVNDKTNDIIFYELNRFIQLLSQNNPNIVEVLFVDNKDLILEHNPIVDALINHRHEFLTKRLKHTFGGYAISQIKKARGMNKKIVNPMPKKRSTPLDFCYIFEKEDGYMMRAEQWLTKHGFKQENIGLVAMPNGIQLYKVYYDWIKEASTDNPRYEHMNNQARFRGIIKGDESDELRQSEVAKGHPMQGFLFYNKDGYQTHCKEHKEYWEWVNNRNPNRYNDTAKHGKGYDGKNLMHCLRLLDTAIDIAKYGTVILERPNREFLMSVRMGEYDYDDILKRIEDKEQELNDAFDQSSLPSKIDDKMVHNVIMNIRDRL